MKPTRAVGWIFALSFLATTSTGFADRDDEDDTAAEMVAPAPMAPSPMRMKASGSMGATPGGAQDIDYARDRINAGEIPHPNTFTAEGLLSQHDLPLNTGTRCTQILCLTGAATRAELLAQPEVRHLAQLGFASNLDPKKWRREPLNLVAVVDQSGSMSGQPLETVKASLRHIALQMNRDDEMAIVLYGDASHVHLLPTSLRHRQRVLASIDAIQSSGSTNMEEGLRTGYDTAFSRVKQFRGKTRVMLFTDERPNVGRTDKDSFMGMARDASQQGVGLTTIGVGTHFGAELATKISSVRGGNLFFFPDVASMQKRFTKDFDVMVTELAYDLRLKVRPAKDFELVGLYGLPGDLVKRTTDGGVEMTVETIFLSKEKGGIFFAFKPKGGGALPPSDSTVGFADLSYLDTSRQRRHDAVAFKEWRGQSLPLGLARGRLLVDEITVLKKASDLHRIQNKTEEAYRLVRALGQRFDQSPVSSLGEERALIAKMDQTLTRLSGHQGESGSSPARRDPVTGLPQ